MTSTRFLFSFALLLFVLTGCSSTAPTTAEAPTESTAASPDTTQADASAPATSELKSAVEYAAALERALDAYEAQRQRTQTALDTATEEALQTLQNDPSTTQVRNATSTWRRQWNDVQSHTQQLWANLADVEAAAAQYFNHLKRQTAQITNPELRASEREQNEELNQNWRNATTAASVDIEALQAHLQEGNDLYITMLNASLRAGFDDNVERLQDLSDSSLQLLGDLHTLTTTGHALTGREAAEETTSASASTERTDR